jgi:hypothetical protein
MAIAFLLGRLIEVVAAGAGRQTFCHLGGEGEHRGEGTVVDGALANWLRTPSTRIVAGRRSPAPSRTPPRHSQARGCPPLDEVEGVEEAGRLSTVALHRYQLLPGQPLGRPGQEVVC